MDNISQLTTVSMIFTAGITTALILPYWMAFLFVLLYVSYQFNIINVIYRQIPLDLRSKYRSKILIILEWICDILRQAEVKKTKSDSEEFNDNRSDFIDKVNTLNAVASVVSSVASAVSRDDDVGEEPSSTPKLKPVTRPTPPNVNRKKR